MRKRRTIPPPPDKPVKFIACSESSQTFNYQRTNKKSSYIDKNIK